jgi:hypothetical protein
MSRAARGTNPEPSSSNVLRCASFPIRPSTTTGDNGTARCGLRHAPFSHLFPAAFIYLADDHGRFHAAGSGRAAAFEKRVSSSRLHFPIAIPVFQTPGTVSGCCRCIAAREAEQPAPPVTDTPVRQQPWPTTSATGCRLRGSSSRRRRSSNDTKDMETIPSEMPPFPASSAPPLPRAARRP